MFREAYAVIPRGTNSDIVTSYLPHWHNTRLWVLARPLSGFAETFSQYMMEVSPGGGSDRPESDPEAEGVLFVTAGALRVTLDGTDHKLDPVAMPTSHRAPTGRCATTAVTSRISTGSARPTNGWKASTRPRRS